MTRKNKEEIEKYLTSLGYFPEGNAPEKEWDLYKRNTSLLVDHHKKRIYLGIPRGLEQETLKVIISKLEKIGYEITTTENGKKNRSTSPKN